MRARSPMNILRNFIFLCTFGLFALPSSGYTEEIKWAVENRFPLFNNVEDFQSLEKAFGTGSASDFLAKNLSSADLRKLLPIQQKTAWDASAGSYNTEKLFSKKHQVRFYLDSYSRAGDCTWKIDNYPDEKHACNEVVRFNLVEGMPFNVEVSQYGSTVASLHEQTGIKNKLIIGLGDSFASGEGNPDYPTIFKPSATVNDKWFMGDHVDTIIQEPVAWWDRTCHRSLLSWQSLYAIRQSISDPHRVVRFASFACSGAEIYDGFFKPQSDTPGLSATGVKLKKSQHNALIDLLCQNGTLITKSQTWHNKVRGPAKNQYFFGEVKLDQCSTSMPKVDELLLSFGGNDFGFSGVVRWGIAAHDPNNHKPGFPIVREIGIKIVSTKVFKPIPPDKAALSLSKSDLLYGDLAKGLLPFQISSKNIFALVYPDPLPFSESDYEGCRSRSRGGNAPFSLIAKQSLPFASYKFGINKGDAISIRTKFIEPLRKAQLRIISNPSNNSDGGSWTPLDANDGLMLSSNNPRTICGTSTSCDKSQCDTPNRLTWVKSANLSEIPLLNKLSDFSAYDPTRARGMRYASDALLTQSGETNGRLDDDWKSGVAHPTAAVHAAIADKLFLITDR